jgi:hypothetical protein
LSPSLPGDLLAFRFPRPFLSPTSPLVYFIDIERFLYETRCLRQSRQCHVLESHRRLWKYYWCASFPIVVADALTADARTTMNHVKNLPDFTFKHFYIGMRVSWIDRDGLDQLLKPKQLQFTSSLQFTKMPSPRNPLLLSPIALNQSRALFMNL